MDSRSAASCQRQSLLSKDSYQRHRLEDGDLQAGDAPQWTLVRRLRSAKLPLGDNGLGRLLRSPRSLQSETVLCRDDPWRPGQQVAFPAADAQKYFRKLLPKALSSRPSTSLCREQSLWARTQTQALTQSVRSSSPTRRCQSPLIHASHATVLFLKQDSVLPHGLHTCCSCI